MSCRREAEALSFGRGAIAAEDRRGIEAHVASCGDCASAISELNRARRALLNEDVEPSEADLQRVWLGLVGAREKKERPWIWWAAPLAACAATLVFALIFATKDQTSLPATQLVEGGVTAPDHVLKLGETLPANTPLAIAPKTKLLVGSARVVSGAESELILGADLEHSELRLDRGHLAIAVDPLQASQSFVISTPAAMIEVIGTVFRVKVEPNGTAVSVDEGVVRVTPRNGGAAELVRAGQRTFVSNTPAPAGQRAEVVAPKQEPIARVPPVKIAPPKPRAPAPAPVVKKDPPREVAVVETARAAEPPPPATPVIPPRPAAVDRVKQAREALPVDAKEARAIAQEVLEQKPAPEIEIEALMISADASRRGGDLQAALSFYRRVADHPRGAPYAEEALLRAARIHVALGDPLVAVQLLSRARERFPSGALEPERHALGANIQRNTGRIDEAASWIESVRVDHKSLPLAREQLAVASVLIDSDRRRAEALLKPLLDPSWPLEIRDAARVVLEGKKQ